MSEDRIIEKIRKLLNLANNEAATEGERDNALRMAYNLIAKHNLDMEDLGDKSEERTNTGEVFYGRPWARRVCSLVAELFFCEYYVSWAHGNNLIHHHFVGKLSNSVTASELSMFLVASIRKESGRQARAAGRGMDWRRSFCLGAAAKIQERVNDLRSSKEKEVKSTGTDLVLADYYKIELELNQEFLKSSGVKLVTLPSRAKGSTSEDARRKGSEYGSKLPLTASVTENQPKRISQ